MPPKDIKRSKILISDDSKQTTNDSELNVLREQVDNLQFEIDVLKETINVLKKDPCIDQTILKNSDKTVMIGALKEKYPLPILLLRFKIARSSLLLSGCL